MPVIEKIKNASVWTEFKEFISQGSVLQLGVVSVPSNAQEGLTHSPTDTSPLPYFFFPRYYFHPML